MRVVLDTNVLIASLVARGVCCELVEHCTLRHTMVTSEHILGELSENLFRKFKYDPTEADEVVTLFRSQMEIVVPGNLDQTVCRDPDDDLVLATAIAGQANCIVTGDKDLLVILRYQNVEIISPSSFADFESGSSQP